MLAVVSMMLWGSQPLLSLSLVFDTIETYAPGFRKLVVGKEVLTPSDLERIFGLTGGVRYTTTIIVSFYSSSEYISWCSEH